VSAWVLCVLLDRSAVDPVRVCIREQSKETCQAALSDWLRRGIGWERRSHLGSNPRIAAACNREAKR
jgi:hypothetical protein